MISEGLRQQRRERAITGWRWWHMSWGHAIRQELTPEEESALIDAVYNKYCSCFSRYKKGMVMRSVRHEMKKRHFAVGMREVRHLVLLTRARFW